MVQWNEVSASLVLLLGSQAVGRPVLVWSLEWNHQPSPNCVLFYFSMHGMRVCVSVNVCEYLCVCLKVVEGSRQQVAEFRKVPLAYNRIWCIVHNAYDKFGRGPDSRL